MRARVLTTAARRLRAAGLAEDGFAVPTVTLMLLTTTALAAVAVVSAVAAQSGASRDQDTKTALPAAEAAVSQALGHYNRIPTDEANPCLVVPSVGSQVYSDSPDASGWCPASTGVVDGEQFVYRTRPAGGDLEIVAWSNVNGVTRRVEVGASSASGQQLFFEAQMQSKEDLTLDSNARVKAGSATDGSAWLSSNSWLCGPASVGLGEAVLGSGNHADLDDQGECGSGSATLDEEPLVLPPLNQGDVATDNDNNRITLAKERDPSGDRISGKTSRVVWDATARTLTLDQNVSLTLGGANYSLCTLELQSNTSLFAASGQKVNIWFDTPEACGLAPGTQQLWLRSNSRISATQASTGIALLFMGSLSADNPILLNSNTQANESCEQNFVLYAPRSDVEMDSNSVFCGAIGARKVHLDSNAEFRTDADAQAWAVPGTPPHYVVNRFVECESEPGGEPPDAGC